MEILYPKETAIYNLFKLTPNSSFLLKKRDVIKIIRGNFLKILNKEIFKQLNIIELFTIIYILYSKCIGFNI
ncbi:hypothetical protein BpHYR1_027222 [Brachionus plicatilis]|uniref:Uncharacterized protein n=1 Tax=Brachionus plicatilis TaxID=10195 RepID=A0A3M7T8N6_BRAPC|nr:hypothetical protein BpHYR1_027222 [Brachionus plicatilis]